jgi:hypothetical protein
MIVPYLLAVLDWGGTRSPTGRELIGDLSDQAE